MLLGVNIEKLQIASFILGVIGFLFGNGILGKLLPGQNEETEEKMKQWGRIACVVFLVLACFLWIFDVIDNRDTHGTDIDRLKELNVPFTDLKDTDYYYYPVIWAYNQEPRITDGIGDGTAFSPNEVCTREQVIMFLWNAAGAPDPKNTTTVFTDAKDKYYKTAILWAIEEGIASGTSETEFGIKKPCTRAQAITFLWRMMDCPEPKSLQSPYIDVVPKDNKYYLKAVLWAAENGITAFLSTKEEKEAGKGLLFHPKADCTRAEFITFLYEAYKNIP